MSTFNRDQKYIDYLTTNTGETIPLITYGAIALTTFVVAYGTLIKNNSNKKNKKEDNSDEDNSKEENILEEPLKEESLKNEEQIKGEDIKEDREENIKGGKKRIFNKTGGHVHRHSPSPPPVNQMGIDQDLRDMQRTEHLANQGISDLTGNLDDIFEYAFTYLQVQWSDQVEDSESNELDVDFFAEFFLDRFIENMATLMQTFIYETTLNRNINRLQEIAPYQGYGEQKLFNFVLHGERYNQLSLQDDLKNIIDAYEYRMQDSYFNFSDNFNQVDDLDSNVFYENNSNYNLITLLDKHREGGFEAFISNYFDLIKDYLIDYFENIYDGIEDDNISIANRGGKKNKSSGKKRKTKNNKKKRKRKTIKK